MAEIRLIDDHELLWYLEDQGELTVSLDQAEKTWPDCGVGVEYVRWEGSPPRLVSYQFYGWIGEGKYAKEADFVQALYGKVAPTISIDQEALGSYIRAAVDRLTDGYRP